MTHGPGRKKARREAMNQKAISKRHHIAPPRAMAAPRRMYWARPPALSFVAEARIRLPGGLETVERRVIYG